MEHDIGSSTVSFDHAPTNSNWRRNFSEVDLKSSKPKTSLDDMGPAEKDLRMLSQRAAKAFRISKFDMLLARFGLVPAWIAFMMTLSFAIQIVPIVLVEVTPNFAEFGKWVWRLMGLLGILNSLPIWLALKEWRPALPLNGKPLQSLPTVDILIPTYKEDARSIVETLVACQRVEYSSNKMHCYVLDDGNSDKLRRAIESLQDSGLLRFSLSYVRRPSNEGKKGGNLNHWLRKYEKMSGEFFVVLDADMKPFPDMLDILMGHYYGLSATERERLAFLQAPQWYQNNFSETKWRDMFNVSEMFFYRVIQPAMSHNNCTVYVGCLALWKRRAIESIGGFVEGYQTEDSVTGCQINRSKVPGRADNWISKYVSQPVAAGETPDSLPALFDQRMRWFYGLHQMFHHHQGYVFATGLTFTQRVLFWVTSASFVQNLLNYLLSLSGAVVLLVAIAYYGFTSSIKGIHTWAFWVGGVSWFTNFALWSFVPGVTFQQAAYSVTTGFLYTPVLIASFLKYYFGIQFHVQDTVVDDNEKRRWHPLFLIPFLSCAVVTTAAIIAAVGLMVSGDRIPWTVAVQIPLWWSLWLFLHQQPIAAAFGYEYKVDSFYEEEFQGRRSDRNIQDKMKEQSIAIDAYFSRGKNYSSSPAKAAEENFTRTISLSFDYEDNYVVEELAESPVTGCPVSEAQRVCEEEPCAEEDSSALCTSEAVRRLSTVLARRSAVEEEMLTQFEDRSTRPQRLGSGSISTLAVGFQRHILGRATHLLSLQSYLSTGKAISSSERSGLDSERVRSTESIAASYKGSRSGACVVPSDVTDSEGSA